MEISPKWLIFLFLNTFENKKISKSLRILGGQSNFLGGQ